ncbi:MAG: iron(III) transport system permease protein [Blastocatellia bacterium]|nr:iron(III) transport system permease protein [Blastocatellia bacterium]
MHHFRGRWILLLITFLVLLYGVVYPNLFVFSAAVRPEGHWSLSLFWETLTQRAVVASAGTSVLVSVLTVLLCALVGVPLAFLFERYTFPGRRFFAVLAALPLVLPPLVGTVAFIFLCGESGILARTVQHLFHITSSPWSLRGWPALLLFHTYTMYPFFYILTGAGLQRVDAGLGEAARSLGARPINVLRRITLPQLTPSLVAAGLLTFMTSMASFSAPLLFGGNVRVLTLEIFNARQRNDAPAAMAETVLLAAISLGTLLFFQKYEGTRRFAAAAMKGATRRRQQLKSGRARTLAAVCGIVFSIVLALPIATLVLVSFSRDGSWTVETLPPAYGLANFAHLASDPDARSVFLNSFLMAGIASLAALLWSFAITALTATGPRRRWKRFVSFLILVPWAMPGTVVAVTIAEAYGRPNALTGSFILVGTFWILPVIYFLRFMPLVVRAVQASIEQMDRALEEAAGSLGANWWRRFWRVRLPLIAPGALAGTLLAFVIALGEYVASVLVFTPANRPVSVAIASAMRDFSLGSAAAYGVVLIGMIVLAMMLATKLEGQRS